MKKKLVIVLLILYTLSSTEFHEVLRLPLLVRHYTEHRELVNNLSVWEFLVLHYKTDVAHDDQDMRLPFKDCHHSLVAPALAMPNAYITLAPIIPVASEKIFFFNHSRIHNSYLEEIFQPPRV